VTDDDVVGGGRQAHAQDQADHGHQEQHQHQVAAGQQFDDFGHHQPDAGQGDRADDDAGGSRGHADADHVACPGLQTPTRSLKPCIAAAPSLPAAAQHGRQRALREHDEDHEQRRPERRQRRGHLFDHQAPDQHHHRSR
jgi:hypothetical protein